MIDAGEELVARLRAYDGGGLIVMEEAANEIERLRSRLALAEARTAELEAIKLSWGEEAQRGWIKCREAEAQAAACAQSLTWLSNEVIGSLPLMERLAREEIGNTNYTILLQRAQEARETVRALPTRASALLELERAARAYGAASGTESAR